ncbi:2276_t:CDS:2, partial [Scutellospora calospora]
REQKNKSIKENQENAIASEDLVDFIFNALPANYDYVEYLFEERFLIILEPLLNNVDTNSDDQARVANISSQHDTMSRIVRYNCGSTIQINIDQIHSLVVISIYHYLYPPPEAMEVSSQIHDFIINHNLLTVPQLYNNIKDEKIDRFLHITR